METEEVTRSRFSIFSENTWTAAKQEIIQKMARERKATAVLIQETHQTMTDQLKIHGFTVADHIPSEHHGIASSGSKSPRPPTIFG